MKTLSEIIDANYSTKKLLWATAFTAHIDKEKMTNYEKLHNDRLAILYDLFKHINVSDKSWIETKIESLEQLFDHYFFNIKELTKYNWFVEIDIEKHIPEILNIKLDRDNYGLFSKAMTDYYETNFDRIIEELCARHPRRKYLLEKNVRVYRSGEIEHAILFMCSQIDGICGDRFDKSFFTKKEIGKNHYVPAVADEILQRPDDFLNRFIAPILGNCPIFAHYSLAHMFPYELNRHKAIHGEDIDYGANENYLKCLSLFKYVSDMLFLFDDPNRYRQYYFICQDDK